jgi:hypothetical protein
MREDEAERIDRLAAVRDSVDFPALRDELLDLLGDDLVSVTWSFVDGVQIRVRSEAVSLPHDIAAAHQIEDANDVIVGPDGMPESGRIAALERLKDPAIIEELISKGIHAIGTDELCGRIVIHTTIEPTTALLNALGEVTDFRYFEVRTAPVYGPAVPLVGRAQFQSTQSGGMQVNVGTQICTSNVPWYQNTSTGPRYFLITAGHCVPTSQWSSLPQNWGGIWWTNVTTNADLMQGGAFVGTAQANLRFGAELDVALWPVSSSVTSTASRTAINQVTFNYLWHGLGWWQWDPNYVTGVDGGDAVGDAVCHSGRTTALRPTQTSNGQVTRCGILLDRAFAESLDPDGTGPAAASWFYSRRRATYEACQGDSGGTVWRSGWLAGVVSAGRPPAHQFEYGGVTYQCFYDTVYSHVGYVRINMGMTAPTQFS